MVPPIMSPTGTAGLSVGRAGGVHGDGRPWRNGRRRLALVGGAGPGTGRVGGGGRSVSGEPMTRPSSRRDAIDARLPNFFKPGTDGAGGEALAHTSQAAFGTTAASASASLGTSPGGREPALSPAIRKCPYSKMLDFAAGSHVVATNPCPESIGAEPGLLRFGTPTEVMHVPTLPQLSVALTVIS